MRLIKVYQPMTQDNGGCEIPIFYYFTTKEEAKKMCDGWGAPPEPKERDAVLLDDGKIWLLDRAPVPLFTSHEDMIREEARAKLSAKERKLLGIK